MFLDLKFKDFKLSHIQKRGSILGNFSYLALDCTIP